MTLKMWATKLKTALNNEDINMKKILILALFFTASLAQANNPCSINYSKRHIPLLAVASAYTYLVEVPGRKIKNTFKAIFKPSSVTRDEDNDSCC